MPLAPIVGALIHVLARYQTTIARTGKIPAIMWKTPNEVVKIGVIAKPRGVLFVKRDDQGQLGSLFVAGREPNDLHGSDHGSSRGNRRPAVTPLGFPSHFDPHLPSFMWVIAMQQSSPSCVFGGSWIIIRGADLSSTSRSND